MKKVLSFNHTKKDFDGRDRDLQDAGMKVFSAQNADEALAILRVDPVDVVIIGPSVPQPERESVANAAKSCSARVIFLYRNSINRAESGDAVISVDSSVTDLLEAVKSLTA